MMQTMYKILAVAGLLLTLIPPFMHFYGSVDEPTMKAWVMAGTVVWFVGAIPWLGKKKETV